MESVKLPIPIRASEDICSESLHSIELITLPTIFDLVKGGIDGSEALRSLVARKPHVIHHGFFVVFVESKSILDGQVLYTFDLDQACLTIWPLS